MIFPKVMGVSPTETQLRPRLEIGHSPFPLILLATASHMAGPSIKQHRNKPHPFLLQHLKMSSTASWIYFFSEKITFSLIVISFRFSSIVLIAFKTFFYF